MGGPSLCAASDIGLLEFDVRPAAISSMTRIGEGSSSALTSLILVSTEASPLGLEPELHVSTPPSSPTVP
jgi:hypothetical protein